MSQRLIDATIREAEKDDRLGSDPDTKFAIGPIIIALIPVVVDLIKKCSENTERAASLARNPGLIRRWRLRGEIEKLVPGDDKDSKEIREHLFNAALAAGRTAKASDFEATVGAGEDVRGAA
jgi:hypothetical protein